MTMNLNLIKHAVLVAGRAPSLHNSQPWQWVVDGNELQLFLDHSRIVRHTDSTGREALISCGAMLDHLRVAAAASGWRTFVERSPDPHHRGHLASVDFWPGEFVTTATRSRASAILRRRTDRLPFLAPDGLNVLLPVLQHLIDTEAARIHVLRDEHLHQLAEASTLTELTRRYDATYNAELDWWTAPFEFDQGIPRELLNAVADNDRVPANRNFPVGGHPARRADLSRDEAVVLVLSTTGDTAAEALACGEALSTVLLECTVAGLATCTVTHVTELPAGRAVVAELIGGKRVPQVLVRIGRVPELDDHPARTPRRELHDVLRVRRP